jgi:Na+-transporting NADH:ubiquinone oxidoreductase subunit C
MSSNDSLAQTLKVVIGVSLVCSIVVSGAAVGLRGLQNQNKVLDKQRNILDVSGLVMGSGSISQMYDANIEPRVVDLNKGVYVPTAEMDPNRFDQRKSAKDPATSIALLGDEDSAGIIRRSNYATVYLVKDAQGAISRVILPMHGRGLWSTMYAFVAVQPDGNTVEAITYYEQGETPGLGGEVANPLWRAKFKGKKLYDADFKPALTVVKGEASPSSSSEIDGLSGATLTSNGVRDTFEFWLGEQGFASYLAKLRNGELNNG